MIELEEKIKEALDKNNYQLLDSIAESINMTILMKKSDDKINFINNLKLNDYERITFLFKMSESNVLAPSIKLELIKNSIANFVNTNPNFLKLLNNSEIMESFIIWFKKNINYNKINNTILEELFKIPLIQNTILFDYDFWNCKRPFELFNNLPKELGYLIAFYYEYNIKVYSENLEKLYNKYYSDILCEKDRMNLLKEEIKFNRKTDIFHMNNNDKMTAFLHCLKQIKEEKEYYNILISIINKTNLKFDEIVKFLYKYDNTLFFKKLCNNDIKCTNDIINKIKYLSKENKIKQTDIDIEKISLDDLKNISKELLYVKMNLLGGPHSTNSNRMFKDGNNSEVRRIDFNGNIKICNATIYDHERAVKELYSDIKFDKKYSSAYEKALEALKKTSAITLIIEDNTCILLLNKKISKEQKETLKYIFNNNINCKDNVLFGITVYDEEKNINSFVYDGNTVSVDDTISYIDTLEINEKAITR